MKKQIVSIVTAGIFILFLQSFMPEASKENGFPDEISTILKTSCYNCHSTGSKSSLALKKVDFLIWDEYKETEKISLLGDISNMVVKEKMPPKKYLKHNPDSQISEAQRKMLSDWTKAESEKLMMGN
jgi:peptide subunit release factor 1 (eRF1)